MNFIPLEVDVEWMDGERRTYQCGGVMLERLAVETGDGFVMLWRKDGELSPQAHVATVPMHNVREFKIRRVNRWGAS